MTPQESTTFQKNLQENSWSEEDIESYSCGKCMYLAAAIHRKFGWSISLVLDFPGPDAYIGHAWAVNPVNNDCVDIDGSYPINRNGWIYHYSEVQHDLNEKQLFDLTEKTCHRKLDLEEWENDVLEATKVLEQYLIPKYSLGVHNKPKIK